MLPSSSRGHQNPNDSDEDHHPNISMPSSSVIENLQCTMNNSGRRHYCKAEKTVKDGSAFLNNITYKYDVYLIVGVDADKEVIPAHKSVLSKGSAVFEKMFNGVLTTQPVEVVVPDVEPEGLLLLLKYLYFNKVRIEPEFVMTTLYTARKYAVTTLETHCVELFKYYLNANNVFMFLTEARKFNESRLAARCLRRIDNCSTDAFNSEEFIFIDEDSLHAVLQRDTLCIREVKIFDAVLRWSEAECIRRRLPITPHNQRMVLGRIFNEIRFPLMTVEEFALGPAQSGLLENSETVQIFINFYAENPNLDRPRFCMPMKELTVNRFTQVLHQRWHYNGSTDRIRITVDQRIFITGFRLYGPYDGPTEYKVRYQIQCPSTKEVCSSATTTISCDGLDITFGVMFKQPVEILPYTHYIISAEIEGKDSLLGQGGFSRIKLKGNNGNTVMFKFCDIPGDNNGTSVKYGQIPSIIFRF